MIVKTLRVFHQRELLHCSRFDRSFRRYSAMSLGWPAFLLTRRQQNGQTPRPAGALRGARRDFAHSVTILRLVHPVLWGRRDVGG